MDELYVDTEEFQRWLATPTVRYDEFASELDALDGSLAALARIVDDLATADGPAATENPALGWFEATLHHRTVGLLFADLRVELSDYYTWAVR